MIIKKLNSLVSKVTEKKRLINAWKDFMVREEVYNKECNTYTLEKLEKYKGGYKAELYAPEELVLENIKKYKTKIEESFGCEFWISDVKYNDKYEEKYYDIKFVVDR